MHSNKNKQTNKAHAVWSFCLRQDTTRIETATRRIMIGLLISDILSLYGIAWGAELKQHKNAKIFTAATAHVSIIKLFPPARHSY